VFDRVFYLVAKRFYYDAGEAFIHTRVSILVTATFTLKCFSLFADSTLFSCGK
jgi:hypothetical protein